MSVGVSEGEVCLPRGRWGGGEPVSFVVDAMASELE